MKIITKSLVLLCAAAPLISFGADGESNAPAAKPAVSADSLFTNSIVAKGKNVNLTRNQLDDEIIRIKAMFAAQGRSPGAEDLAGLEEQVLDSLIGKQLILTKATDADRVKGKEEFEKTIQKIKTNNKLTDEQYSQRLTQQLRLLNVTKEDWEKQSAEQAMIPLVLARELGVNTTDAEVKKFYDDNPAKFEQPETVRAAHILLMTTDPATRGELSEEKKAAKKKQAEDLLKRAKAGEDFGKLAKEFSEDPGSKDNDGEYTFPRGQMVPAFEDAAFSQGTNQISDIVTTQFGYHIIKTYEKIPAKKVELEKVAPDIKEFLTQQTLQAKAPDFIAKLRKDAGVEILDPKLKAASEAREKILEGMKDAGSPAPKVPGTPK